MKHNYMLHQLKDDLPMFLLFLCMCMSEFPGADQLSENVTFVQGLSNVNRPEGDA
jgi:hypothetical protein